MAIIHIGLTGLGFMGKTHLYTYKNIPQCQVKKIYTRSSENQDVDNIHITANFDDLLTDPEIDVIDICLPTFLHEEYIIKAANAKKHIICEKPITLTTTSLKRIMAAVQENNVQLFVGHVLRFWPEYQTIKSHSSRLGKIEVVHAQRLGQSPKWSAWFQNPEKSGGALFDLHIHDIDFSYYLLGEIETVFSTGVKNKQGAWVHVMTTLTFKNGTKAFIEASHLMPKNYPFTASFRAQSNDSTIEFLMKGGENIENINQANNQFNLYTGEKITALHPDSDDAFYNELTYFLNCIREKKPNTIVPLSDVMYTLQALETIEQSLQTGQVINM